MYVCYACGLCVQVQTASVGAQLDVSLPWGPATTLRPLHNEPPPAFTLRSGELHTLVKAGWFDPQHSTKEKPVMVSCLAGRAVGGRPRLYAGMRMCGST